VTATVVVGGGGRKDRGGTMEAVVVAAVDLGGHGTEEWNIREVIGLLEQEIEEGGRPEQSSWREIDKESFL